MLKEKIKNSRIYILIRQFSEFIVKNLVMRPLNKRFIILILGIFCVLSLLSGVIASSNISGLLSTTSFASKGLVNTLATTGDINVYWNSNLTNKVSTINWGTISPGAFSNITIYVQNIASTPVTLNLSATDWNPTSCSSYMTLTWNYLQGQELLAGQSILIVITLQVLSNITDITNFSFNTMINANA